MLRSRLIRNTLLPVLVLGMTACLFLPFYSSTSDGFFYSRFGVIGVYKENEVYFSIYNGFNSLFGMSHVLFAAICVCMNFIISKGHRTLAITLLGLLICSLILLAIGIFFSGYFLSPSDKMHDGFYTFLMCELFIIILLFSPNRFHKNPVQRSELLDQPNS